MRVMLAEMKLIRIKNKMLGFFINLQEHMIHCATLLYTRAMRRDTAFRGGGKPI